MLQESFFYGSWSGRPGRRANRGLGGHRPRFEALEERRLMSFTPVVNYPVDTNPLAVVTGDFDGDGHLDLATASQVAEIPDQPDTLSVLLGDGAGGFGAATNSTLAYGFNRVSLTAADFDNDGKSDLAFTVQSTETDDLGSTGVGIFLSKGDGTFGSTWAQAVNYTRAVAAGDFNNDGNSDLAVSGEWIDLFGQGWGGYAQVLLGNGHGGFAYSPYSTSLGGILAELAVGDFNRDGKLDAVGVAGENDGGYGAVVFGRGVSGAFSSSYDVSTTSNRSGDVAVGDFTGDGKLDVITAADTIDVMPADGHGAFGAWINQPAGGGPYTSVAAGDFNGDGKLDAVATDADHGTVSVMLGNGDGTLRFAGAFATGLSPSALAVGDFNGDGRPDVAAANNGSDNVSVLLNDGNWSGETILIGDYNRDSMVDAADYVVWRRTQGTMVTPSRGADGNADGVVDEDDYDVWRAHFGQTLPSGAGSGSFVAPAAITNQPVTTSAQTRANDSMTPSVAPGNPARPTNSNWPIARDRDLALAALDPQLPLSIPRRPANLRRSHGLSTTGSGMIADGKDLLLVGSSAAEFDQHRSEGARNSHSINNSTEEAVKTHRDALDIAFTALERAIQL